MTRSETARRELVAAPGSTMRVPWNAFAPAVAVAAVATFLLAGSCSPLAGPVGIVVLFPLFLIASATMVAVPILQRVRSRWLSVDEGGVRCRIGAFSTYWPFALVGSASIETAGLGVVRVLVLRDATERPFLELPLVGAAAELEADDVLAALAERRDAAVRTPHPLADTLGRRGQTIDAWCGALDRLIASQKNASTYRDLALDVDALCDAALDVDQAPDLRAGAAYVAIALGTVEHRAALRSGVGAASPPVLLLLASRAPEDPLALGSALANAAAFLDEDDWAAALGY